MGEVNQLHEAIDFANSLVRMSAVSNRDQQKLVIDNLLLEHRTNQQSVMRFILRYIDAVAKDAHGYDARNEASVKFAQQVLAMNDGYPPPLPYI